MDGEVTRRNPVDDLRDLGEEDATEIEASKHDLAFVKLDNGHALKDVDIYNRWPGMFALGGVFTRFSGASSPVTFIGWAELYFIAIQTALVGAIMPTSGMDTSVTKLDAPSPSSSRITASRSNGTRERNSLAWPIVVIAVFHTSRDPAVWQSRA